MPSNPVAFESERGLIAGILIGQAKIDKVVKAIPTSDYFAEPNCSKIYTAILKAQEQKKTPDLITISEMLTGEVSASYLAELTVKLDEINFGSDLFETLTRNVVENWAKRTFEMRTKRGDSAKDILADISSAYSTGTGRYLNPKDLASLLHSLIWDTEVDGVVNFPFTRLNHTAKGLRGGELVIVAGRTAVGKSSFLENIASHNAFNGKKVLLANAEMNAESVGRRIVSRLTGIPLSQRKPTEDERKDVDAALDKINSSGYHIYDQGMMRTSELEEQLKKERFDLVCLDYLQLFEPSKRYKSRYEQVTYACDEIKGLAVKYNVPFLVAAQYNRLAEGDQPNLTHIRDSGAIEQNADMVISLWVKDDDPVVNGKRGVYLDLLKNRNGFCIINSDADQYRLWFSGAKTEFSEMEDRYEN